MTVKGLFTHFNDDTEVQIFENEEHKEKNIISWNGKVVDLKGGSRNTYNYCKVKEWYVNKNGVLEIITKE